MMKSNHWAIRLFRHHGIDCDQLADFLCITRQSFHNWRYQEVPARHCMKIEQFSNGVICAKQLNPRLFTDLMDMELWTIRDICTQCQISRSTFYSWRDKNQDFPQPKIEHLNAKKLFSKDEISTWVRQHRSPSRYQHNGHQQNMVRL